VYLNLHAELDKLFRERDNQIQPIFSLNSKIDRAISVVKNHPYHREG
jgi:hypothetical protein